MLLELHWTLSPSMQADSKYFKDMLEAVASYGAGYQPPTDEELSSHLLVKAVDEVDKELAYLKATISQYGSAITCNGSDTSKRPILNMLQVCANGVRFLDFIDASKDTKVCVQCLFQTANTFALIHETPVTYRMQPTLRTR